LFWYQLQFSFLRFIFRNPLDVAFGTTSGPNVPHLAVRIFLIFHYEPELGE